MKQILLILAGVDRICFQHLKNGVAMNFRPKKYLNASVRRQSARPIDFLEPRILLSTVYNPASQFSTTTNPNGVWQYGYGASDSVTDFGRMQYYGDLTAIGDTQLDFWQPNNSSYPIVGMQNGVPGLAMAPDNGVFSKLEFTAPYSGIYNLVGDFDGTGGATSQCIINFGGSDPFEQDLAANVADFDLTDVGLAQGQTIAFEVGVGLNGNRDGDTTGLVLTITADPTAATTNPVSVTTPENTSTSVNVVDSTTNSQNGQLDFVAANPPPSGATLYQELLTTTDATSDVPDTGDGDNPLAVLLAPSHGTISADSNGTILYTPDPNYVGTDTFSYAAFFSATPGTGTAAQTDVALSNPSQVTVNITPVNVAPSFTAGADVTNTTQGAQTVPGWATNISAGPTNESAQTVQFLVSTDQPSLFSVAPAIDPTGDLTYTPALNAGGTANVTVMLKDNGGTTNGGVDTSQSQTFTISVTPTYTVGNLPATFQTGGLTVPLTFFVNPATGQTGPLTMQLSQQPIGSIIFDPDSGLFNYMPSSSDHFNFNVTFETGNGGTLEDPTGQMVTIMPGPAIEEDDLISDQEQAPPATSSNYVNVSKSIDTAIVSTPFNQLSGPIYNFDVSGDEIDLGPSNPLYNQLCYDTTSSPISDVANLSIYADTLVIDSALRFPRTNITIYARVLQFSDATAGAISSIDTTPLSTPSGPGQNAGNITLHCETIEYPTTSSGDDRFILRGGDGSVYSNSNNQAVLGIGGTGGTLTVDSNINLTSLTDVSGGTGALSPSNGPAGSAGSTGSIVRIAPEPYDWLHPSAVRAVLDQAEDTYLDGNISSATQDLTALENELTADTNPPAGFSNDLTSMLSEVQLMRNQAVSGLDYFGNPAGWVPQLSFAANFKAYSNEIGEALRIEYVAKYIERQAAAGTLNAPGIAQALSQLDGEVTDAAATHTASLSTLASLKSQLASIQSQTQTVQSEIATTQQQLETQAQQNVNDANQAPFWKQALGVLSAVAYAATPIFGPAAAGVGEGLSEVSQIASEISSDPSNALDQVVGAVGAFDDDDIDDSSTDLNSTEDDPVPPDSSSESDVDSYISELESTGDQIGDAADAVTSAIQNTQAPTSQVTAELQSLEAQDPTFTTLVSEVTQLENQKQQFAQAQSQVLQQISTSNSEITADEQTAGALDAELQNQSGSLNAAGLDYVQNMERAAANRLLEYQYYVEKSYEYEFLQPYSSTGGNLDISSEVASLQSLASQDTAGNLDADVASSAFAQVEATYMSNLQTVASSIWTQLNTIPASQETTIPFHLTADQLTTLNQQGSVTIDVADYIPSTETEAKIVQIGATELTTTVDGTPANALLTLQFTHGGASIVNTSDGQHHYFFDNAGLASDGSALPVSWSTTFDAIADDNAVPNNVGVATSDVADIESVIGDTDLTPDQSELLFAHPGADSQITITKSTTANIGITLNSATFFVEYTFVNSSAVNTQLNVSVAAGTSPRIEVDEDDLSMRQDGQGSFIRSYAQGSAVTLTAPVTYGLQEFQDWQVVGSNAILSNQPKVALTLSGSSEQIMPVYATSSSPFTLTAGGSQTVVAQVPTSVQLGSFTDTGANAPYTIDVDWGDGSAASVVTLSAPGPIPSQTHSWSTAGTKTVSLSVTDGAGHISNVATFTVVVMPTSASITTPLTPSTSTLVPSASTSTVPSSVVGGNDFKAHAAFNLSNGGSVLVSGICTVQVFAVPVGSSLQETIVGTLRKNIRLKVSKTVKLSVTIKQFPADLTNGSYALIIRVTDPEGNTVEILAGHVDVAQPYVDLSHSSLSDAIPTTVKSGKHVSTILTLDNTGNVAAIGTLTLTYSLFSSNLVAIAGVPARKLSRRINIKAGHVLRISFPFSLLDVPAGSYFLTADGSMAFTVGGTEPLSLITGDSFSVT